MRSSPYKCFGWWCADPCWFSLGVFFFFSSRRRHTRCSRDWSSDVCSSDLQDQVEAPLNAGVFLENSARAYDYTRDLAALRRRLPVLRRMIDFVIRRYQYSKETFPPNDSRHGLMWGSPEADNGEPNNDFPESHPYYYQNASWVWRGLHEHARCLELAGSDAGGDEVRPEGAAAAPLTAAKRTGNQKAPSEKPAAPQPA